MRRGLGKWCEPHGPCGWLRVLPGQVGIRHGVSVTTTCPSRWRRRARQQQRHRAGGGKGAAAGDWPVLSGSRHVCGVAKPTVGRRAVGSGSRRPRGTCWRRQRSLAVTAVCVGSGARCQPGCCGGQRGALSTRGSEVGSSSGSSSGSGGSGSSGSDSSSGSSGSSGNGSSSGSSGSGSSSSIPSIYLRLAEPTVAGDEARPPSSQLARDPPHGGLMAAWRGRERPSVAGRAPPSDRTCTELPGPATNGRRVAIRAK